MKSEVFLVIYTERWLYKKLMKINFIIIILLQLMLQRELIKKLTCFKGRMLRQKGETKGIILLVSQSRCLGGGGGKI